MSLASYDQWKQRSDVDEQPEREQLDECGVCGGLDGSHDRQCPDSSRFGDLVDREIDRIEEGRP